ncbi:response regulator [bacterium]|nr:response regulator [bacterium]
MKRVLIVDDEQIVLEVLQRILNRIGYQTVVIGSGQEALKQFDNEEFDLVLLDVLMPEFNGFDIAKKMKKAKPDQKIIMVTGLGEDAAVHQAGAENVPVDNVLSKPFSFEKVKNILEDTLGTTVVMP